MQILGDGEPSDQIHPPPGRNDKTSAGTLVEEKRLVLGVTPQREAFVKVKKASPVYTIVSADVWIRLVTSAPWRRLPSKDMPKLRKRH